MRSFSRFTAFAKVAALALALAGAQGALAQGKGLDEPFRDAYKKSLTGKTVAYIPMSMLGDLTQGWYYGLKRALEPVGMKVVLRDPNWNTTAGAQAFTALIAEKPAAIVVHNPDIQTYAKLIKKAEDAGIYVIQINMSSLQPSTVFIGADWVDVGEMEAQAVVDACKGKSNKIAIMQGSTTAATSAYSLKGVENVLAKNPQIQVVSNQAADWDAAKAKGLAQTVLKQHPDMCGIIGFWDGMDIGVAAAIKEAGLTGKVFLATSGAGEQKGACDLVKSGAFDMEVVYHVPTQANDMAAMIKWLVQGGVKPGAVKQSVYTTLASVTKANAGNEGVCWKLEAMK
jgi:simple sugar transport system substrate-binding protein/ribose transport system substrate-binding protein